MPGEATRIMKRSHGLSPPMGETMVLDRPKGASPEQVPQVVRTGGATSRVGGSFNARRR
jgi:hypothetical protein